MLPGVGRFSASRALLRQRSPRTHVRWSTAGSASVAPRKTVIKALVTPKRPVPAHIQLPPYAVSGEAPDIPWTHPVEIKTPAEIAAMRASGALAKHVLQLASELVKPGTTTDEIDAKVHDEIIKHGAYPSPLNYNRFPKSCCTSVNEVVCHGIPDLRPLEEGDIVNIDITVYLKGFHGDCSATYAVGKISDADQRLIDVSRRAMEVGIEVCQPGRPFAAVGNAIEQYVTSQGVKVQPEMVGHGLGALFHTTPWIFHTRNQFPGVMRPGMVFTVEPVVCSGLPRFRIWDDNWTAVAVDGKNGAQFEHTILITPNGYDILTK